VLSVTFLLLAIAASSPGPAAPQLRSTTSRPLEQFASCFAGVQAKAGRPWAFIPGDRGGVFTNSGATRGAAPYWLRVREAGTASNIELFVTGADAAKLTTALEQCR